VILHKVLYLCLPDWYLDIFSVVVVRRFHRQHSQTLEYGLQEVRTESRIYTMVRISCYVQKLMFGVTTFLFHLSMYPPSMYPPLFRTFFAIYCHFFIFSSVPLLFFFLIFLILNSAFPSSSSLLWEICGNVKQFLPHIVQRACRFEIYIAQYNKVKQKYHC